jgi:ribose 5-phosphate isomerase A
MSTQDEQKRAAAEAAVERVEHGMRVGLGSGSTALLAVEALGRRVGEGLVITGVATSRETEAAARQAGIPLDDLLTTPHLDVTIDGADEFDAALRLVKGGGGALLREKIVAAASARLVIVVDATKRVDVLGAFPLPVEVVPFARGLVADRVRHLGVEPRLRADADGVAFTTDEGNLILDCPFGRIDDPETLAARLAALPGVVEHGLFLDMADEVLMARDAGVEVFRAENAA